MRMGAHHMVRNMTAGMALITCREPLFALIAQNLKNAFVTAIRVRNVHHVCSVQHKTRRPWHCSNTSEVECLEVENWTAWRINCSVQLLRVLSCCGQELGFCLQGATHAQKDLIEQACQVIAQDNTELACCFIQKTAVEKAMPEMDKRLTQVRFVVFQL